MLDDGITDPDPGPTPPPAFESEIKVRPADALFGPVRLEETGNGSLGADAPSPPHAATPDIKIEPIDGMLRHAPPKNTASTSTRPEAPLFQRAVRYSARTAAVVGMCGLAWAGGVYYSHLPLDTAKASWAPEIQPNSRQDEIVGVVRQMAEDLRALKAKVEAADATRGASPLNPVNSGQTTAGPTMADLAGRVDKLNAEVTAKLSQLNGQLATIQQQLPATHPTVVARAQPPQKRVKHIHDAFDPSKDPNAPGVPRPIGSR